MSFVFPFPLPPPISAVPSPTVNKVCSMVHDREALRLAQLYGLNINTVSWEDCARDKGSCFGPCISDMTLKVAGKNMPLIKASTNFSDETWDVDIDNIPIIVGNEDDTMLRSVTLREYLGNFKDYLHNPNSWKGNIKSLLANDDTDNHVICSAQACFLPMEQGSDSKFHVSIFNYQSSPGHPAVLSIVASANGTSAEIIDDSSQELYFNKNGKKASFIGQRLSDHRIETGSKLEAKAAMTAEEKSQNMLLIIQVPLKCNPPKRSYGLVSKSSSLSPPPCPSPAVRMDYVDVEAAIIKVGEAEGDHREVGGVPIERDPKYPVRVTLQYYKATSNGNVDDRVVSEIATELMSARKWAVAISSLVTETTDRKTEWTNKVNASSNFTPSWFSTWFAQHQSLLPQYTLQSAANKLFATGKFEGQTQSTVEPQLLDILTKDESAPPKKSSVVVQPPKALPAWNVI